MHMGDVLISPEVGGTMLAGAIGVSAYSIRKVKEMDERKLPLMGVMAAFVFAAQMINFTIPGTGSSGHIGGGLLLAILLGPSAGFLSMAAILLIQALFFADGGFLAYGCNLLNMGFFSCFLAYPLIYKTITRASITKKRITFGSIAGSVVALQLGAFAVVLQTLLSGKTELPFSEFLVAMQGIHLLIGVVEGVVTAAVASFVWQVRPDIICEETQPVGNKRSKGLIVGFLIAALALGGLVSLYASANPDGLEWSIGKVTDTELKGNTEIHSVLEKAQEKTAILPDYGFKNPNENAGESAGTSFSGIAGAGITLGIIVIVGAFIKIIKKKTRKTV